MQKSKNYTLSIMVSLIFLIVIFLGGGAYLVLKYHASNSSVEAATVYSGYKDVSKSYYLSSDSSNEYNGEGYERGYYYWKARTYIKYNNALLKEVTTPAVTINVRLDEDLQGEVYDGKGNFLEYYEYDHLYAYFTNTFQLVPKEGYIWNSSKKSFGANVYYGYSDESIDSAYSKAVASSASSKYMTFSRDGNIFTGGNNSIKASAYTNGKTAYYVLVIDVQSSSDISASNMTGGDWTLSFNFNGGTGTGSTNTIPVTLGKTISSTMGTYTFPPDPTMSLYSFTGWAIDGTYIDTNTVWNWGDATAYAQWTFDGYRLTYSVVQGSGSIVGASTEYVKNASVTITASPNNGYAFDYWILNGAKVTSNPLTFTISKDSTLKVYFKELYTITLNTNNSTYGTVTGGGSFDKGSTITIKATPYSGYDFDYWQDSDGTIYYDATMAVTLLKSISYMAYFKEKPQIVVTLNDETKATISKSQYEQNLYIVVQPMSDYYVTSFILDGKSFMVEYYHAEIYGAGKAYRKFYSVNDTDNAIVFQFEYLYGVSNMSITLVTSTAPVYKTPPISGASIEGMAISATDGGEARVIGYNTSEDISTIHLSAVPFTGYNFIGWIAEGVDLSSYKMSDNIPYELIKGKVVIASFKPITNSELINNETNNTSEIL